MASASDERRAAGVKPCTEASRNVWFLSACFLLLAGGFLTVLPANAEMYFPFYISNPNTAAFLGANYLASAALDLASWRQRVWARGRIAAPAALLFATLIGILGAENLQYFRFEWPVKVATIFWFVIYWGVPVVATVTMYFQTKLPGHDPERVALLPVWMRAIFMAGGISMLLFGVWLYVTTPAPQYQSDMAGPPTRTPHAEAPSARPAPGGSPTAAPRVAPSARVPSPAATHGKEAAPPAWRPPIEPLPSSALWPWDLTSSVLGSQYPISLQAYVGVWTLVFGFIMLHGWWENDLVRIRPMLWGAVVGSSLQILAVIRYPIANLWEPVGLVYMAVQAATLVVAIVGLKLGNPHLADES